VPLRRGTREDKIFLVTRRCRGSEVYEQGGEVGTTEWSGCPKPIVKAHGQKIDKIGGGLKKTWARGKDAYDEPSDPSWDASHGGGGGGVDIGMGKRKK